MRSPTLVELLLFGLLIEGGFVATAQWRLAARSTPPPPPASGLPSTAPSPTVKTLGGGLRLPGGVTPDQRPMPPPPGVPAYGVPAQAGGAPINVAGPQHRTVPPPPPPRPSAPPPGTTAPNR